MSEELRPCPFCGGEAESTPGRHEQCYARCSMFGCEANNPWVAIEDWNSRPIEDALRAELEEARNTIENGLTAKCLRDLQSELARKDKEIKTLEMVARTWTPKTKYEAELSTARSKLEEVKGKYSGRLSYEVRGWNPNEEGHG